MQEIKNEPTDNLLACINEPNLKEKVGDIAQLINSIKSYGVLCPVIINHIGESYFVIDGLKRIAAANVIGLPSIPTIFVSISSDDAMFERYHANAFNTELNPVNLCDFALQLKEKLNMSIEGIARVIQRSRGFVYDVLGMERWPENLILALNQGDLSFSVAKEIAKIPNDSDRNGFLKFATDNGASLKVVRGWVNDWFSNHPDQKGVSPAEQIEMILSEFQKELRITTCWTCGKEDEEVRPLLVCMECYSALFTEQPEPEKQKTDELLSKKE